MGSDTELDSIKSMVTPMGSPSSEVVGIDSITSMLTPMDQSDSTDDNTTEMDSLGFEFIDADTVRTSSGERYRLQGFDAPEVTKLLKSGQLKFGTAGGYGASKAIIDFAKKNGFTKLKDLGYDAAYGRKTGILVNDQGESLSSFLLKSGIVDPTEYTTIEDLRDRAAYDFFDNIQSQYEGDAQEAAKKVRDAMVEGGADPFNFKTIAFNERERMGLPPEERANAVMVRHKDRTIDNLSLNPLSDSWDVAIKGTVNSARGFSNMLGADNEAEIWATNQVINDKGKLILGWDDMQSAGDIVDLFANNIIMSLPYMAATTIGMIAAPATYGASLMLPVALYTGDIWNEQEEKNAATAIAGGVVSSVLDRVGLKGIGSVISKSGSSKEILKKAAEQIAANKNIPLAEAEQFVLKQSKAELAALSGEIANLMEGQLTAKNTFKALAKGMAIGTASEGITEGTQEVVGYLAAHAHDNTIDFNELTERALQAASIGGFIGGGFGATGSAMGQGAIADAVWRVAPEAESKRTQRRQWVEEEKKNNNGYIKTVPEIMDAFRFRVNRNTNAVEPLADKKARHFQYKKDRSVTDTLQDAVASIPGLWRRSSKFVFTDDLQAKSRTVRAMGDVFDANTDKVFGGSNFENYKHHAVSKYQATMPDPMNIMSALNNGKRPNSKEREVINKNIYKALRSDPAFLASEEYKNNKHIYDGLKERAQQAADLMYNDQYQFNPNLGYVDNYLGVYQGLNKKAIANDKAGFISALKEAYNLPDNIATELTNNILDSNVGLTFDLSEFLDGNSKEGFSVIKGSNNPSSHKNRTLGLSTQEKGLFNKYLEGDFFANVEQATKSAARFVTYEKFVGRDGKILSAMLDQAAKEGLSPEEVNKIAAGISDILDAESGNYKRPTSEFGKKLEKIQRNILLISTFAGLPLATLSSFPELALTQFGIPKELILGKKGSLAALGRELGKGLWSGMQESFEMATNKHLQTDPFNQREGVQARMRELGYYEWSVGAASKTGVTETDAMRQKWIENYFKLNGLQGFTQITRAIRLAIATDYIKNHVKTLQDWDSSMPRTNQVALAEESLRNLGIDPKRFIELFEADALNKLDQNGQAMLADMYREAEFNFVNEAIMLPRATNRPLIYQDPRFALFNQFQGFVATFQSTFLPKLWNNYVKNGSPGMKFQAFSTMMMLIALAYASQELRDRVKFGKQNPYLDEGELIRRAVSASGLLGLSDRVINTVAPMYETRSDGVSEWIFNETVGQSPALGMLSNVGAGAYNVLEGEYGKGTGKMLRATPIGSFTSVRNWVSDTIDQGYNPRGENNVY